MSIYLVAALQTNVALEMEGRGSPARGRAADPPNRRHGPDKWNGGQPESTAARAAPNNATRCRTLSLSVTLLPLIFVTLLPLICVTLLPLIYVILLPLIWALLHLYLLRSLYDVASW